MVGYAGMVIKANDVIQSEIVGDECSLSNNSSYSYYPPKQIATPTTIALKYCWDIIWLSNKPHHEHPPLCYYKNQEIVASQMASLILTPLM